MFRSKIISLIKGNEPAIRNISCFFNAGRSIISSPEKSLQRYSPKPRFQSDFVDPIEPETIVQEAVKKTRIKTAPIPKITLISFDNSLTVTTEEEAAKLAEKKKLKLVKILDVDAQTQRPVYRLMTGKQYLEEELNEKKKLKQKKSNALKGDKVVLISAKINDNDFRMKVRKSLKWLQKKFEVRVVITGSQTCSAPQERLYEIFENEVKEKGRIVQKRIKNGDIKFQILPPKEVTEKTVSAEGSPTNVDSEQLQTAGTDVTSSTNPNSEQLQAANTDTVSSSINPDGEQLNSENKSKV